MDARYIKVTAEELHAEVTMEEAARQAWAEQERRAEEELPEEVPDWVGEDLKAALDDAMKAYPAEMGAWAGRLRVKATDPASCLTSDQKRTMVAIADYIEAELVLKAEEPVTPDPLEGCDPRDLPEPVPERTAIDHAEAAALLFADGLTFQAKAELNKGLRKVRGLADVDALLQAAHGLVPLLSKRGWFRSELGRFKEIEGRLQYVYLPSYHVGSCRPENLWRIAKF